MAFKRSRVRSPMVHFRFFSSIHYLPKLMQVSVTHGRARRHARGQFPVPNASGDKSQVPGILFQLRKPLACSFLKIEIAYVPLQHLLRRLRRLEAAYRYFLVPEISLHVLQSQRGHCSLVLRNVQSARPDISCPKQSISRQ